ncbi:MAG: hypothetical protein ACOC1N_02485 [Bacillota bacterium]
MDLIKKMEQTFFDYAVKYDNNIKALMKERDVEISIEELDEILADAKNITVK